MPDQTSPNPRRGLVMSVVGDRYIFLAAGNETGGAFAAFEFHIPAGNGPPLHVHHRESEFFYVLDGEFEFYAAAKRSAGRPAALFCACLISRIASPMLARRPAG